jgi:hypothetical protein
MDRFGKVQRGGPAGSGRGDSPQWRVDAAVRHRRNAWSGLERQAGPHPVKGGMPRLSELAAITGLPEQKQSDPVLEKFRQVRKDRQLKLIFTAKRNAQIWRVK